MDIKIVEPTPTETEQLEEKESKTIEGSSGEINSIAARQVLEIEDGEYEKEVNTLLEWAKEKTGSDDYEELRWAIRDLQLKIGTPPFGDRIKNLARFAYLELEEKRIKAEKDTYR